MGDVGRREGLVRTHEQIGCHCKFGLVGDVGRGDSPSDIEVGLCSTGRFNGGCGQCEPRGHDDVRTDGHWRGADDIGRRQGSSDPRVSHDVKGLLGVRGPYTDVAVRRVHEEVGRSNFQVRADKKIFVGVGHDLGRRDSPCDIHIGLCSTGRFNGGCGQGGSGTHDDVRTDGHRRGTDDIGRRQGSGDPRVSHDVKGLLGVRGPDADVGRLGDDEGVLVSDGGRVLGRRDEEVVVRGVLDAHVGHIGIVRARLCTWLNPQPDLSGVGRRRRHPGNVTENLEGDLGA